MTHSQELGALKSKHSPAKGFLYFSIFIMILMIGFSAVIYFQAILAVQEGRMRFSGNINIMYGVIGFLLVFGLIILLTALKLTQGKTYYLYEKGIVSEGKEDSKTQYFTDIDDLYLFSSGRTFTTNNIAFRDRKEGNWETITVRYTEILKAIKWITAQHEALFVPKALKDLDAQKSVTFQYISYKAALNKKLFATGIKSFLKVQTQDIVVTKEYLLIDSKKIMIADLDRFSVNNWISEISLKNHENKVVFSTSTNGIFSAQSFVALLDQLINHLKIQQATDPSAPAVQG